MEFSNCISVGCSAQSPRAIKRSGFTFALARPVIPFQPSSHNAAVSRAMGTNRNARICRADVASAEASTNEAHASGKSVPTAKAWELDFCSRPILDERGKKVWELLICDADRTFEYAQYFPNNKINSTEVRRWGTEATTAKQQAIQCPAPSLGVFLDAFHHV